MYILNFYVPESHLKIVKEAIFAAGAGQIGSYSHCAWQTLGQGQFKPLVGNHAFIGKTNQLEIIDEYKVEIVCEKKYLTGAIAALKLAHPYETPAYYVLMAEAL